MQQLLLSLFNDEQNKLPLATYGTSYTSSITLLWKGGGGGGEDVDAL